MTAYVANRNIEKSFRGGDVIEVVARSSIGWVGRTGNFKTRIRWRLVRKKKLLNHPRCAHVLHEAGAPDYLSKPVDTDQLMSLLRVWLYRRIGFAQTWG